MNITMLGGLLRRPEAGAFLGLVAVLVFFGIFGGLKFLEIAGMSSWLNVAASLGIIAIPVGLLMIAGELDISVGAMVPAGAMLTAVIGGHYGLPVWWGIMATLAFGVLVGLINGLMVVRTDVPSLIITLGSLFAVQGILLGLTVLVTKSTNVAIKAEGCDEIHVRRFHFLWRHFPTGPVAGRGGLVGSVHSLLCLLCALFPLRQLDLRHGRRQGQRPQCRHSDRPHDDTALHPVGRFSVLRGHVPGASSSTPRRSAGASPSSSTRSSPWWSAACC